MPSSVARLAAAMDRTPLRQSINAFFPALTAAFTSLSKLAFSAMPGHCFHGNASAPGTPPTHSRSASVRTSTSTASPACTQATPAAVKYRRRILMQAEPALLTLDSTMFFAVEQISLDVLSSVVSRAADPGEFLKIAVLQSAFESTAEVYALATHSCSRFAMADSTQNLPGACKIRPRQAAARA